MNNKQFSDLSYTLTSLISAKDKKQDGIYFTPYNIIEKTVLFIINYVKDNNIVIKNVLEPSCGSCEFIKYIDNYIENINIYGVEFNDLIYDKIKNIFKSSKNKIIIKHDDFCKHNLPENIIYDLVIGNPPYFVLKKNLIDKKYYSYFTGRPNIYIIFILKSLEYLNKNGILAFILPNNFMNCLYYDKLREYIYNNYKILQIFDCSKDKYLDTSQNTIIFIIQNTNIDITNNNDKFTLKINNYHIFNTIENSIKLKELYTNSTTLKQFDFNVSVGNVVWNQVKDILTSDTECTRLIYSSDIINNQLSITTYKNKEKQNYIKKDGINDVMLVVNRGYGKGKYKFNHCIIDCDFDYLIENHLICIQSNTKLTKQNLIKKYKKIINSFNSSKTEEFIDIYFGNNAINTVELQQILPLFDCE